MVKSLQECCLACIARNISTYSRLGDLLSRRHKQLLLERMVWHELLTPETLPSVSYHLFSTSLQRINLSYSHQVSNRTLELLAKSGCMPTSVTLDRCPNVTEKGLMMLAKILTKVEELTLQNLKHVTVNGLKSISSKSLTSLNLQHSEGVTDTGILALVRGCPNIETLNVSELHKLTDVSIVGIAETLGRKLVEVDVSESNAITCTSTLALAKHCRNLRVASFESCVKLDGSGLVQMAEHCDLSSLCVSFCYKLTRHNLEIMISLVRANRNLVKFEAMGIMSFSPVGLEMLTSTRSLTHLCLCGVPAITDKTLEMLTRALGTTLIDLDISNCLTLTDQSCESISKHCQCLEVLGMRNLREVKGTALSKFFLDKSRVKNFRSITLSGSKNLPVSVVQTITTHCPNLETVTLAGLQDITDEIAYAIAHHCPNIQHVSFRNCSLTDDGVCEIAVHCSRLQMIALAGIHDLTDKCIIALAENCPFIEELYLSGCAKTTKQAITYLKDCAVYRVFVNHSTPNAPLGLLMAKDLDTGQYTRVDDMELPQLQLKKF